MRIIFIVQGWCVPIKQNLCFLCLITEEEKKEEEAKNLIKYYTRNQSNFRFTFFTAAIQICLNIN